MHGNLLNDADVVRKNGGSESVLVFPPAFWCLSVWFPVFLFLIFLLSSFLILYSSSAFHVTTHPSVTPAFFRFPLFFHHKSDIFSNSFLFFLPFIPPNGVIVSEQGRVKGEEGTGNVRGEEIESSEKWLESRGIILLCKNILQK